MGKIFLSEFEQKLNKKQTKLSISAPQTKIDFEDFANRRNQTFISYLSKYLTDDRIRRGIVKINPYTVKFGSFSRSNNFGTHSGFYVTLSLFDLSNNGVESWECIIYECVDMYEDEAKTASFNNGQLAIEYFVDQIKKLHKN
tara:strand:+ start:206 stop:631 length:426 start_codon:yes stop_codon:yes gene_type:complete